jgi:hypothetical protein
MKRVVFLCSLLLVGCDEYCTVTEGTGLFELFASEGCFVSDANIDPAKGVTIELFHKGNTVLVDGLDDVNIALPGLQYVGRRGSCFVSDVDGTGDTLDGHCDYVVRDFTKVSETESTWTVELLDVYTEAYGNKGTLKGVFKAQSFDQGFGQ